MIDFVMKNTVIPLLLRLGLAVIFIYHGLQLVSSDNDWGSAWATKSAEKRGQEPPPELKPQVAQLAVAWGELLGGIALALGFLTRLAAAGIAIIMGGAIYTVHWPHGFNLAQGGYEYNFVILVMCAALILGGGGTLAVDRWFRFRRRKPA